MIITANSGVESFLISISIFNDLGDCFTTKPDFAPYNALPVDVRIFDPAKAMTPLDEKFDWKAFRNSPELDNLDDMKENTKRKEDGQTKVDH